MIETPSDTAGSGDHSVSRPCHLFLAALFLFLIPIRSWSEQGKASDVLIYGGSFSAIAAVQALHHAAPEAKIVLIVPQDRLGEIGTVGAQNYWDARQHPDTYAKGTFKTLFDRFGPGYDPREMANHLSQRIAGLGNLTIHFGYDISGIDHAKGLIERVKIRKLERTTEGFSCFSTHEPEIVFTSRIYIDASFNGRLLRLSGFTGIIGRNDYTDETRQQAATLMFRIMDLDVAKAVASKRWKAQLDFDGTRLIYGGWGMDSIKEIAAFNRKYQDRYKLKEMNIAGNGKAGYWVNALLAYNVDATKERKDLGTDWYPKNTFLEIDEAYPKAKALLLSGEVEQTLRAMKGFEQVRIVDVADILYIRESIHSSKKSQPSEGDFAVTAKMLIGAGKTRNDGFDRESYPTRIGMAFYGMDSNGYLASDPWKAKENAIHYAGPKHPVFVPFETLLNPGVRNVLACGYGANISSIAWFAMRVLPNQMVLGDAAGMAAAKCLKTNKFPLEFSLDEIREIQDGLRTFGAALDK